MNCAEYSKPNSQFTTLTECAASDGGLLASGRGGRRGGGARGRGTILEVDVVHRVRRRHAAAGGHPRRRSSCRGLSP